MFKLIGVRTAGLLLGAVALFAVVGFAASFAINSGHDIVNAEGETLVVICDDDVTVEKIDQWRDPDEGGPGHFYVKEIQLHDIQGCSNVWVTVVLTGEQGQALATVSEYLPSDQVLDFSSANVKVSDLYDIHVLFSEQQPAP